MRLSRHFFLNYSLETWLTAATYGMGRQELKEVWCKESAYGLKCQRQIAEMKQTIGLPTGHYCFFSKASQKWTKPNHWSAEFNFLTMFGTYGRWDACMMYKWCIHDAEIMFKWFVNDAKMMCKRCIDDVSLMCKWRISSLQTMYKWCILMCKWRTNVV